MIEEILLDFVIFNFLSEKYLENALLEILDMYYLSHKINSNL